MSLKIQQCQIVRYFRRIHQTVDLPLSYQSCQGIVTTRMVKKKNSIASSSKSATTAEPDSRSDSTRTGHGHGSISLNKDGSLSIAIQVKAGSKQDAITVSEDHIGVQISAPPVDGEANTAIIKYFSQVLKIKKNDIELKGGKSRQKRVIVQPGCLTVSEALEHLKLEQSGQ